MDKNEAFYIGILLAAAGGSVVAGLHEIDTLLLLAPPAIVLSFLSLVVAASLAAVLAAAMRHGDRMDGMRRLMKASVTLLIAGYVLLLAASWYRYFTDPDMFEMESTVFRI